jgi:hypothetical protein
MERAMPDVSAPQPLIAHPSAEGARDEEPIDPRRAIFWRLARDRGGSVERIEREHAHLGSGLLGQLPEGVGPETRGREAEAHWLYVGDPGASLLVSRTLPRATPQEAWDALAENMAISMPGELKAGPIEYSAHETITSLGVERRADRLEARELDGGVQVFIVTAQARPGLALMDLAQSRILDETGRAPLVFDSADSASDYMAAFIRDFRGNASEEGGERSTS